MRAQMRLSDMKITTTVLIWVVTLCHLVSAEVIQEEYVQGIRIEHVDTKAILNFDGPEFMEHDQFIPGNILFTNGQALKSLDLKQRLVNIIVGKDNTYEYQEGTASDARFEFMTSFYQHNSSLVVLADSGNTCVRTVSRITNSTAVLSGQCDGNSASIDGSFASARFFSPSYFAKLPSSASGNGQVAVADYTSIRMMDFTTETVSTILPESDSVEQPQVLILSPDNSSLLFSFKNGLAKLDLEFYQVKILSQGYRHGRPVDGPLLSAIFGEYINAMIFLNNKVLLVSDYNNNLIRVVDLAEEEVTSICQPPSSTSDPSHCDFGKEGPGDIKQCSMCYPQSFLVIPEENRILLGTIGELGYIKTTGLCQEMEGKDNEKTTTANLSGEHLVFCKKTSNPGLCQEMEGKDNEKTTTANLSGEHLVFCKKTSNPVTGFVIGLSVGGGLICIALLVFGVLCGLRHKTTLDKYFSKFCCCCGSASTFSDNVQFRYTQTE